MQIPQQSGSTGPYAQASGDSRNPSMPYPPYQHQSSPPGPPSQQGSYGQPSPYGQQQYGQQSYPEYASPRPQANYAPYGGANPPTGYGYDDQSQHNQQSYQHQAPHYAPGPPPPDQYGAPTDYNYSATDGTGPQEDRGVMGALAGGATGAWAGHKVNHGFIGALGGAFAGHKLQDAVGGNKKKNKHKKSHSSSSSSSSSGCSSRHGSPPPQKHHPPPKYAGNFSGSATQITLDHDYDLIAYCGKVDGSRKLSSINLNRCLTNSNGQFRWSKEGNFGGSARNVRLLDGGRILEAELADCGGHWVWARVVLDEKIGNNNGELVMV